VVGILIIRILISLSLFFFKFSLNFMSRSSLCFAHLSSAFSYLRFEGTFHFYIQCLNSPRSVDVLERADSENGGRKFVWKVCNLSIDTAPYH